MKEKLEHYQIESRLEKELVKITGSDPEKMDAIVELVNRALEYTYLLAFEEGYNTERSLTASPSELAAHSYESLAHDSYW